MDARVGCAPAGWTLDMEGKCSKGMAAPRTPANFPPALPPHPAPPRCNPGAGPTRPDQRAPWRSGKGDGEGPLSPEDAPWEPPHLRGPRQAQQPQQQASPQPSLRSSTPQLSPPGPAPHLGLPWVAPQRALSPRPLTLAGDGSHGAPQALPPPPPPPPRSPPPRRMVPLPLPEPPRPGAGVSHQALSYLEDMVRGPGPGFTRPSCRS